MAQGAGERGAVERHFARSIPALLAVTPMPPATVVSRAARDDDNRPELADVGRLARRLLRRAVSAARAEENSIWHLLAGHLGPGVATLPVASGNWPQYDQVNVQAGVDAWLAEPGRSHRTALDELLDPGNQLTRVLLGAPGRALLGTDAVIPEQGQRPRP